MMTKRELKNRLDAEQRNLEARIAALKIKIAQTDEAPGEALHDGLDALQQQLDDFEKAIAEGWDNLTEPAARRIIDILNSVDARKTSTFGSRLQTG